MAYAVVGRILIIMIEAQVRRVRQALHGMQLQIDGLWSLLEDPEELRRMREESYKADILRRGLRKEKLCIGSTVQQIQSYLAAEGCATIDLEPAMSDRDKSTYSKVFSAYTSGNPPVNVSSVPDLFLKFRMLDRTLIDWWFEVDMKDEHRLAVTLSELWKIRQTQAFPDLKAKNRRWNRKINNRLNGPDW